MKAMVLRAANTPFEMTEVPDPVAGPGEAVARVIACGAGLTIQHVKAGGTQAVFPRIIGHEITGEIVALDLTSLATISNHQVTKPTTSNPTHQTAHVVGVVPENLKGVTGDRLTVVPSGYYFWAVQKGVARVLDYAGATVGDVLTVSTSTAGMVDSTGAVGPGVGIALETVGSAGLVKALFKAPLA